MRTRAVSIWVLSALGVAHALLELSHRVGTTCPGKEM